MKKAKNLIMVVVILASMTIPVVAGATASIPYRHKDAWFQSYSQGCAGIYRCYCNPVNNYLSASAKVQYDANGTYKWTSTKTSSGSNVEQRVLVVTAPNGYYANAVTASFIASCSGGARQKLADSATR